MDNNKGVLRIYPATRNSAYKVFQNLIKGNSYSDVIAFRTLAERDSWMEGFIGKDWKSKLQEVKSSKWIQRKDEIHMTVTLDLSDTDFGMSRQKASQCDLIIMEDTNEKEDSPFRYTFWSASCDMQPDQVYTTLQFSCEMDVFMTIPFENMFKKDVKIRLDRGNTSDIMGYASQLSYGENFQFSIDNYVPVYKGKLKDTRYVFSNKKSSTSIDDCAVLVSLNSSQAQGTGELLNYSYQFPIYYSLDSSTTVTQHVLKLDKLKVPINVDSQGLVIPDITYLVFKNKIAVPTEIRRSEYLISLQQLPIPYSKITPSNPDEVISIDGKQLTAVDVSLDAELRKWLSFSLDLNKIDENSNVVTEQIGDMLKDNGDTKLDPHNKMMHSSFNKAVMSYGTLRFEIKSENWDFTKDSSSLEGKLIFTPQAVNIYADLNNAPYYDINYIWNYRSVNIASDFKLPTIVSGDQGTMQNFNTINLTNSINRRDAVFQETQGAITMAKGASDVVSGGIRAGLTLGLSGRDSILNGMSEITQGVQMEMSAHDNINKQAANLADSRNNVGQFNDGSKDGIEAYDSDGIEVYKYTLQEPLRSMVVEYLRMYGYNLGGNLYTAMNHIHARAKFDYIRAADDIGVIYQALAEEISPQQAKIISLSLLQGIRLWWSDKFTYVGDYTQPNNVIDQSTGKEIPNTDIQ